MPERRIINGEPCEKVERAGDLRQFEVVYSSCLRCPGKFHRGWLTRRAPKNDGWVLEPSPQHLSDDQFFVVADSSIPGYVWRPADEARDDDAYELSLRGTRFEAQRLARQWLKALTKPSA